MKNRGERSMRIGGVWWAGEHNISGIMWGCWVAGDLCRPHRTFLIILPDEKPMDKVLSIYSRCAAAGCL